MPAAAFKRPQSQRSRVTVGALEQPSGDIDRELRTGHDVQPGKLVLAA
jgi:hypothetical protein